MADKKITDLTNKATAATADIVPIVDPTDNTTKRTTVAGLATAIAASFASAAFGGAVLNGTYPIRRQNDTTNSAPTTSRILTGWGQITGAGASGVVTESVTFDGAFISPPVVYVSYLNAKTASDATSIDQFNSGNEDTTVSTSSISTSGFTIRMYKPSVFGSGTRFGYSWIAIGT